MAAAAGGVGLDQAAIVDVALGDDAVERRHHALIGLVLEQHLELGLLGADVRLGHRDGGLLRLQVQPFGVALLLVTQPLSSSLLSRPQVTLAISRLAWAWLRAAWFWASVACACAIWWSSSWRRYLGEKLPGLDVIADVDIALGNVAADRAINVGGLEGLGRARQLRRHHAVVRAHRRDAHSRHQIAALRGRLP